MATIRICTTEKECEAWDRYVFDYPGAHFFQTYGWLKSYQPMGLTPHVLVYEVNGLIAGGVAFVSAKVPLLPWRVFIIPHGPLPSNPDSPAWLPLMQRLDKFCLEQKALYAQLYPHELSDSFVLQQELEKMGFTTAKMFRSHRFSSTPLTIDLRGKTDEDILKSFRKNTRYYVRRALNSGLVLRTDIDQSVFDKIYEFYGEHSELKGYALRPYWSFRTAWEYFSSKGWATFLHAWHDQTIVGAIFLLFTGRTAYYMNGAYRREFSDYYPAEFLQWHAICEAMKRQLSTYDMVNAINPSVAQFKRGFRPQVQHWHDPKTKVYRPLGAQVISFAERSLRPMVRGITRYLANLRP